jgi:hypothetical protein
VYEVPLGATVNVTIVNDEGYHTAMIEGYNVDVKPDNTNEKLPSKNDLTPA